MSRQLAIAATFSTLALTALALFAPGSARMWEINGERGTTIEFAAPSALADWTSADWVSAD